MRAVQHACPSSEYSAGALDGVRRSAAACRACALWKNATQTVFGEGAQSAALMLVGEQPGDQEDRAGRPFVGPAGQMLDRALADAGIDRRKVYVTNAVKHFKNEPRGKRRIHKKPSEREIEACEQWLAREIAVVGPKLIVALGTTAARAVVGHPTPIERNRGKLMKHLPHTSLLITVHPSMLLRLPQEYKAGAYRQFVKDLKLAAPFVET
ncbi:MAG TPA: UdgX family uracil-DNA binding protein [Burkholderiales bacterium]|nr:UdgX family uracil-DNA binding protein [Burkholderiales bacterium]